MLTFLIFSNDHIFTQLRESRKQLSVFPAPGPIAGDRNDNEHSRVHPQPETGGESLR